jgi:hypothetical protein
MSQKKIAKKKEREKEVKKKLLVKREETRAKAKIDRQKEKDRQETQRVSNRVRGVTIRNNRNPEEVIDQLAHNYEILKALEEEQRLAKEIRDNSNQLNIEGIPEEFLLTPETPKKTGLKASAEVVFTPNPEPTEN